MGKKKTLFGKLQTYGIKTKHDFCMTSKNSHGAENTARAYKAGTRVIIFFKSKFSSLSFFLLRALYPHYNLLFYSFYY